MNDRGAGAIVEVVGVVVVVDTSRVDGGGGGGGVGVDVYVVGDGDGDGVVDACYDRGAPLFFYLTLLTLGAQDMS